jgi:hypothetical protein
MKCIASEVHLVMYWSCWTCMPQYIILDDCCGVALAKHNHLEYCFDWCIFNSLQVLSKIRMPLCKYGSDEDTIFAFVMKVLLIFTLKNQYRKVALHIKILYGSCHMLYVHRLLCNSLTVNLARTGHTVFMLFCSIFIALSATCYFMFSVARFNSDIASWHIYA